MSQEHYNEVSAIKEQEMCDEFGYYEVSKGYRRIPGNICAHGHRYEPMRFSCSWTSRLVSMVFTLQGISALLTFWAVVMALILRPEHN